MLFSKPNPKAWNLLIAGLMVVSLFFSARGEAQAQNPEPCSGIFFSEYIESKVNNLALEIFNGTGAPVDLSAYTLQIYQDGSLTPGISITLSGTLANQAVFVVVHPNAIKPMKRQADLLNGNLQFDGNDAIALMKGAEVVDVIGRIGENPGVKWGTEPVTTESHTLVRKPTVSQGDVNGTDAFDPAVEWIGYPKNETAYLGDHVASCLDTNGAPEVISTVPLNLAALVPVGSNLEVQFSEDVSVTAPWFTIQCGISEISATYSEPEPGRFVLNPATDFAFNQTCTVTVLAAQVRDVDPHDPPDEMLADFTWTFTTEDAPPTVISTVPANLAGNISGDTNLVINFSEDVQVSDDPEPWFAIDCDQSGSHTASVGYDPETWQFTLVPSEPFTSSEVCTVTIKASQVSDADLNDPRDLMELDYVWTFATGDLPPTVTSTFPAEFAVDVPVDSSLQVHFNEDVLVSDDPQPWFLIECTVSGIHVATATYHETPDFHFILTPEAPFTSDEVCTVTIRGSQVSDADTDDPPDLMPADYIWAFTVADQAPAVTGTTPVNLAVDVPVNANIFISFTEAVNLTPGWFSIQCSLSGNQAAAVMGSMPGTSFTLDPVIDFMTDEVCTVTLYAEHILDTDNLGPNVHMLDNYTWTFTTLASDEAPTVTSVSPASLAANIALDTNITVNFSEPVHLAAGWFSIQCTLSGAHAATVVGNMPGTSFTLDPVVDFQREDICTVTIDSSKVTDDDGVGPYITMLTNKIWTFSVVEWFRAYFPFVFK